MKKLYILDTSVVLTNSQALFSYGSNDILIPIKVLEELDSNKKRQDSAGLNARTVIKHLDSLREKGNLLNGVKIRKGLGKLFVSDIKQLPEFPKSSLNILVPDNEIILTAFHYHLISTVEDKKVILVSCDVNMRIKASSIGLSVEAYSYEHVIKQISELYTGFASVLVDDQIIDLFYSKESVFLNQKDILEQKLSLHVNQFVMLISNKNEKKTALARFTDFNTPLKRIRENGTYWGGFQPKNKEQSFAMDLLLDPNIPVVSIVGKAGGGKTLCALAAGLQQTIGDKSSKVEPLYRRLIISRPVQPLGKDIGFLPGTLEEKLLPWLTPIQDNLRFLIGDDIMLSEYIERGIIELEALTYIRGRSIQNSYIVIDETQNLNRHEIKTILTRVGNNSKIILTGDIEQIDNVNVDETSNGLTYAIEKLKHFDITGHITLHKGERSKVATICSQEL